MKLKPMLAILGVVSTAGIVVVDPQAVMAGFRRRTPITPGGEYAADGTPLGSSSPSSSPSS